LSSVAFSCQVNQTSVVGGTAPLNLLGCSALEAAKATSAIHRRLLLGLATHIRLLLLHAREHVRLLRRRSKGVLLPSKAIVRWSLLLWCSRVKCGLPLVSVVVLALAVVELLLATCILPTELAILAVALLLCAIVELGLEPASRGRLVLLRRWCAERILSGHRLILTHLHLLLHLSLALLLLRIEATIHVFEGGVLAI